MSKDTATDNSNASSTQNEGQASMAQTQPVVIEQPWFSATTNQGALVKKGDDSIEISTKDVKKQG